MAEIKVAVMNTSKEITEVLEEAFKGEGFVTCSSFTYFFKEDFTQFDTFIEKNKPQVIIYDIAIPYKENYELFKKLSSRKSAKNCIFVLTTTNKEALEGLVGKTSAYEIIGKPYDLLVVVNAVVQAYERMQTGKSVN